MADNIPGVPPAAAPPSLPPGLPGAGGNVTPFPIPGQPRVAGVSQPLANMGNQAAATAKIANAIKMLQDALPEIPMGSELHTEIFKIVPRLTKALGEAKPDPSMQLQQIIKQAREQSQGSPMAALSRLGQQPQPGGGLPPAMPAPPGPGAAAAA